MMSTRTREGREVSDIIEEGQSRGVKDVIVERLVTS